MKTRFKQDYFNPLVLSSISVLILTACTTTMDDNDQGNLGGSTTNRMVTSGSCGLNEELREPPTLRAVNGVIQTQLSTKTVSKCLGGKTIELMSYVDDYAGTDQRPVGPSYVMDMLPLKSRSSPANPQPNGPVLNIAFKNELADPAEGPFNCGHHAPSDVKVCTNLHTHGFHVSPESPADNVYLVMAPGEGFNYSYNIPNYHPPGTHWLHAHLHGSTAPQVQEGMAGALILKGDVDRWLESEYDIGGANDKTMILQQLSVENDESGNPVPLCPNARQTSINGQCLPKITVNQGDVHRWRLIHAGISATVNFAIENSSGERVSLSEFAKDGINTGSLRKYDELILQPGYRSDILVKMPDLTDAICQGQEPCTLDVLDAESTAATSFLGVSEPRNVIAQLVIQSRRGNAQKMPPSHNEHWKSPYPEITEHELAASGQRIEHIYFTNEPDGSKTVNGFVYPDGGVTSVNLGTSQAWQLWVGARQQNNGNHPFHIHVNPFEVIERDVNGNIVDRYFKDTILVRHGIDTQNNPLEIRTRYENFSGRFVLHCHNLNHEDAGMMKSVEIK